MSKTILAAALIGICGAAQAADWPAYGGPNGNGTSPETGLLRTWPDTGPEVLWRAEVGIGYGGPSVRAGKVYLLDRVRTEADKLRCFDLRTGAELWHYGYDAPGELSHDGSRSTPTVTEAHVYTLGPFGHLHCIGLETRQPVWSRRLLRDYEADLPRWGVAASPVLHGDTVIVSPMSANAGVVALDRKTGDEVWRSPPLGNMAYVTPRPARLGGVDQLLVISATRLRSGGSRSGKGRPKDGPELRRWLAQVVNRVAGIGAADGRLLWSFDEWHCMNPIPAPTPIDDERIFVTGGYHAGSVMLKIEAEDGAFQPPAVLFRNEDLGAQVPHPILHEDHLYLLCNGNFRKDGLVCMALDGTVKWQTGKEPQLDRGHLLLADGLLFNLDGREGLLRLIEPNPAGYRELDSAPAFQGGEVWAPLALSRGRLLVRSDKELRCLDVKGDASGAALR